MATIDKRYCALIQAIENIFPAATPKFEDTDNNGFSIFFPEVNRGIRLRMDSELHPVSFIVFAQDARETNQRISVMYEVNEELDDFLRHFKTVYEEIIEQLEYRLWRLNRLMFSL